MVVGAGEAGAYAVNICNKNPKRMGKPVILVDDAHNKQGLRIQNVPVRGTTKDIPKLVSRYGIREIIIAIPSLGTGKRMQQILELCNQTHCHTRIFSEPTDTDVAGGESTPFIRELNISDFLSRDEIELDMGSIAGYLSGKTVMVTGGGGSIGSELCRQIMRFKPKLLIIFEIYENCAYELMYDLRQRYGKDCPVITLIGSIRDKQRLDEVFDEYHPEVVFHAAAAQACAADGAQPRGSHQEQRVRHCAICLSPPARTAWSGSSSCLRIKRSIRRMSWARPSALRKC